MTRKLLSLFLLLFATPAFAGSYSLTGTATDSLLLGISSRPGSYEITFTFNRPVTFYLGYDWYYSYNEWDAKTGFNLGGNNWSGGDQVIYDNPTVSGIYKWTVNQNLNYTSGGIRYTGEYFYGPVRFDFFGTGGTPVAYRVDVKTPVPEPAEWALLIAGFGLAGGALRRRTGFKLALAA